MKGWAEYCSSDEESDDGLRHTHPAASSDGLHPSLHHEDDDDHEDDGSPGDVASNDDTGDHLNAIPPVPSKREYDDLPNGPPYTAYVRNLSYDIRENDQLVYEINGLLERRYEGTDVRVQVVNARVGIDRESGKRKGFGYVEFTTVEDLTAFLDCDDGNSEVMGRNIHIRVATNQRSNDRGSGGNRPGQLPRRGDSNPRIDGSKFRGGNFSRNNNGGLAGSTNAGGVGGNTESLSSSQNKQRPSLRLAPRTKPMENSQTSTGGGISSSIFGEAKPRNNHQWNSSRKSVKDINEPPSSPSKDAGVRGGNDKVEDASLTARGKNLAIDSKNNEKKDSGAEVTVDAKRNEHGERYDRNHSGGRGRGKGRANDRNSSSSSLSSSGRGGAGGRGGGRGGGGRGGRQDGPRRESSKGRGGGQNRQQSGNWGDKKNNSGRGGSNLASTNDARKKGSGVSAEPAKTMPTQKKEAKPKTKVINAFAALGFDDSDSD
uniref:RRM domain-containing protein n=1 Tax=Ditylum brightwellii TaxID=49249 RepID=A0A6U3QS90_9STRA|mmetsp:Transcript_21850/g.32499  ORF Transcript_21850/g.32499 Transcript_21850/m.32499 type:complete len:487 (+) Transcript_21850:553-2013(+)